MQSKRKCFTEKGSWQGIHKGQSSPFILVKSNRLTAQQKQKKYYDLTAKEPTFHLGQQVMLKKFYVKSGLSKKLAPDYEGPFYITKVGPNRTFNLRRPSNHKPLMARVHANRLKPYHNHNLRRYAETLAPQPQPEQNQNVGN